MIIPFPTGDHAGGRTSVHRLSRRLPAHDEAASWHALGAALGTLGDHAAAIAAYRHALRIDRSRVASRLALGNLLFDAGQCELAFRCFEIVDHGR